MSGAEKREIIDRDVSVGTFVEQGETYYADVFERIQRGQVPRYAMNIWGLLVPWLWAAWRGVWLMFWLSLAIDVLALVCVMQVVKFSPLLAEAQLDAAANSTLIARYTGWIETYTWAAIILFIGGRLWMGSSANRWYFRQYAKWRIDDIIPSGTNMKRLVVGLVVIAIVAPLTTYRATQLRLDERACFNQIRAAEGVELLLTQYDVPDLNALGTTLTAQAAAAQERFDTLDAISDRTSEQNTARSAARSEARDLNRNADLVDEYQAIDGRDRFDCFFIDDFPTLARLDPPEDVTYRRVTDDDGNTEVIAQIKPPVEGRKVTLFTYSAESIDISINWLRASFAGAFDAMTNVLRQSLIRVEVAFMQTPWPVVAFLFLVLSWAYTGTGTTIFVGSSLAFLAFFELWQIAMQTMALVVVSTAVCVLVGLPIGIWMAKNKIARFITEPILDVMQTIPSLSYLVPAVAFFGISQPPAVLATVIFAMPPMIKLTALGIRQVPESTKEAALAFGASERQLLRKVELPMAVPSIMAGLNQTIMLALSMATISAFIGAEGLGAIVTAALGDAQAGKGLLAGIAIALVAMMIDRILRGIRNSFSRI
jgi:ABC-type proline/glycine betaine transport system permease subunit